MRVRVYTEQQWREYTLQLWGERDEPSEPSPARVLEAWPTDPAIPGPIYVSPAQLYLPCRN